MIERVLLLVTQLDFNLTQLEERVEEMANSINHVVKRLEELKDELRNDVSKTKDLTPEYRQGKGILKRMKGKRRRTSVCGMYATREKESTCDLGRLVVM